MKVEVGCTARFSLHLDKYTVEALHFEASNHYDGVCRGLAADTGLLTTWQRIMTDPMFEDEGYIASMDFRQLDTLCKVAENSHLELAQSFYWAGLKALQYFNDNAKAFPATTITSV